MTIRFALLMCLFAAPLLADEVILKNGSSFAGTITEETDTSVTIRMDSGAMTFEKSRVERIVRAEGAAPAPDVPSPAKTIEQGPLEDLVARVGPGGVTRSELGVYLLIYARDHGKEAKTLEEQREALEPAIEDELVFQAALADGALDDEYVRWSISSVYKSMETVAKVEPQEFTEGELRAYYDAHPDAFTTPAAVRLEGIRVDHLSEEELADAEAAMRRGETPASELTDSGWLEPTESAPVSKEDLAILLALKPGEVAPVVRALGGIHFLYRCTDRREGELKSFEESRGRAKFLLAGEKVDEKSGELSKRFEGGAGATEEERIFRAALAAGVHRRPECRPYIVNAWLQKNNAKKGEIAPELRKRFAVEVLLKD